MLAGLGRHDSLLQALLRYSHRAPAALGLEDGERREPLVSNVLARDFGAPLLEQQEIRDLKKRVVVRTEPDRTPVIRRVRLTAIPIPVRRKRLDVVGQRPLAQGREIGLEVVLVHPLHAHSQGTRNRGPQPRAVDLLVVLAGGERAG